MVEEKVAALSLAEGRIRFTSNIRAVISGEDANWMRLEEEEYIQVRYTKFFNWIASEDWLNHGWDEEIALKKERMYASIPTTIISAVRLTKTTASLKE